MIFLITIGVTTNDDWNNKIKNNPAPWAEVEIPGKYILTYPSANLRPLTDIVALGALYDNIMNWVNKLAGLEKRFRTERFVFDIQIGGGNVKRLHIRSERHYNLTS